VPLPLVLIWLVAAYGYPREALVASVGISAVVLALSYLLSSEEKNINWVFGLGRVQHRLSQPVYLAVLYLGFIVVVFLPTHWLLLKLFPTA
jgi:hypothetical protein